MEFSTTKVMRNFIVLKKIKLELNKPENSEFIAVGLDFVVELILRDERKYKFKCMLCQAYLDVTEILKHLQTELHQSLFLNQCFPSVSNYLRKFKKFARRSADSTLKLIASNFVKTLVIEVCKEIARRHIIDEFCPLMTQRTSEKEFNSSSMAKFVVNDMSHVHESNFPETKSGIDEVIKRFIVKSKQLYSIADIPEIMEPPIKKTKISQTDEQVNIPISIMTQNELERMKVAINIAMELVKNGLQISPAQLEESVKSYYKYELQKVLKIGDFEEMENLSMTDLKLLIECFESLRKDEQEKLTKYLNMLKIIEDATFKELAADGNCANVLKKIL